MAHLRQPVAVVTGAANGIGAAVAARLREDGMLVVGLDMEPCEHGPSVEVDVSAIEAHDRADRAAGGGARAGQGAGQRRRHLHPRVGGRPDAGGVPPAAGRDAGRADLAGARRRAAHGPKRRRPDRQRDVDPRQQQRARRAQLRRSQGRARGGHPHAGAGAGRARGAGQQPGAGLRAHRGCRWSTASTNSRGTGSRTTTSRAEGCRCGGRPSHPRSPAWSRSSSRRTTPIRTVPGSSSTAG